MNLTANREIYQFTTEDIVLLDAVHALIQKHHDQFVTAGRELDRRYGVDAMIESHRPPIPEAQRLGMLENALRGDSPDLYRIERLAEKTDDYDLATQWVIRSEVLSLLVPSREDWEPIYKRFGVVVGEFFRKYLTIETPSPDWEWSSHVLLVAWLIVEPRANKSQRLTEFQSWTWDAPKEVQDLYPDEEQPAGPGRDLMPYTIFEWKRLLVGVRMAIGCAQRMDLLADRSPEPLSITADLEGLKRRLDEINEKLAGGDVPQPRTAKRSRYRAPAPPGWMYLQDAAQHLKTNPKTLHYHKTRLPSDAWKEDSDSHEILLNMDKVTQRLKRVRRR